MLCVIGIPPDVNMLFLAWHQMEIIVAVDDRQNLLSVLSFEIKAYHQGGNIICVSQGNMCLLTCCFGLNLQVCRSNLAQRTQIAIFATADIVIM